MKSELGANGAKSKLKEVLYAWNYVEWGGAQVYFLGLAARLRESAKVRFIVPRSTSQQFLDFCAARGVDVEFTEAAADLSPANSIVDKLRRHWCKLRSENELVIRLNANRKKGTLVHVDLAPWQSLSAILRLLVRGPVFMTMHNALPPVSKLRSAIWKAKFAIVSRLSNFHIFASNADAREGLRPFVTADFLARVEVTYTNVNPDEIAGVIAEPQERDREFTRMAIPKGRFTVVCLGQFIDRKGRWIFLDAARRIIAEDKDFNFVWISNSTLSAADDERLRGYGLADNFFLLKSEDVAVDHAGLLRFLRCADAFALPSYVEGLPISLLEAMALGVPSISTAVYAIPEAITDGETGLLVPAGDEARLADAIRTLRRDAELGRRIGAWGRDLVLERFNETAVAAIAENAYNRALND